MPITRTLPILETDYGVYRVTFHRIGEKQIRCYEARRAMDRTPIVRINSRCEFAEVMGSTHCECGWQLTAIKQELKQYGRGVIVYSPDQEGRGHGLEAKMEDMALQREHGIDHEQALKRLGLEFDTRTYNEEVQALIEIGLPKEIIHFSGNQEKTQALRSGGFVVVDEFEWCRNISPAAAAERGLKEGRGNYHYRRRPIIPASSTA